MIMECNLFSQCTCVYVLLLNVKDKKIKSVFVGSVGEIFQQEFIFSAFGK